MRRVWMLAMITATLCGVSGILPAVTQADTGQLEISTAPRSTRCSTRRSMIT